MSFSHQQRMWVCWRFGKREPLVIQEKRLGGSGDNKRHAPPTFLAINW
ncbi:MAG: hypothetical protein ACI8R9_000011 [Paraglaciecola sp.]|jgi:hypothetical protein